MFKQVRKQRDLYSLSYYEDFTTKEGLEVGEGKENLFYIYKVYMLYAFYTQNTNTCIRIYICIQ